MLTESVRVNHDGTLVVPPFECAWLTGEGYEFRDGAGCVHFEAKGDTDVTIILKPTPGAKRLQPLASTGSQARAQAPEGTALQTPSTSSGLVGVVEANYTVILGSHRNSCLKVERNGSTVCQVQGVPGSRVSPRGFQTFWIDYHAGMITVGTGEHCLEQISWQWVDKDAIPDITCVGLSCWDRHVSYRNIQVLPSHKFKPQACPASPLHPAKSQEVPSLGPPTLLHMCVGVLNQCLGSTHAPACRVAQAAELLMPNSRTLYRSCLEYLARNLKQISICLGVSAPGTSSHTSLGPAAAPHHSGQHPTHHVHGTHSADAAMLHSQGSDRWVKDQGSAAQPPMTPQGAHASLQTASSVSPPSKTYNNNGASSAADMQQTLDRETVLDGFLQLPASMLCDLLQQNSIAVSEKEIFDVIVSWAQPSSDQQHPFLSPVHVTSSISVSHDDGSAAYDHSPCQHCNDDRSDNLVDAQQGHVMHVEQVGSAQHAPHAAFTHSSSAVSHDLTTDTNHHDTLTNGHQQTQSTSAEVSLPPLRAELCSEGGGQAAVHRSTAEVLRVLSYIRYPLMTYQELAAVKEHPLVAAQPALLNLITEALGGEDTGGQQAAARQDTHAPGPHSWLHNLAPGVTAPCSRRLLRAGSFDSQRASSTRFQRRQQPASYECAYVCDGDRNGVLHFIGTMYGTQTWVNPALARRVDIRASSPAGRHTDPKALAGDKFLRTNFAGPRYVNGAPDTWWQVDLGQAHTLIPTYYTMRTDGSSDYVRSWVLQGSSDTVSWTDLQHHTSDPAFKRPGQYMSWPIRGPAAQAPYRAYRLLLTGPTTSQHQPHNFPLAHLELYGYLHRTQAEGS